MLTLISSVRAPSVTRTTVDDRAGMGPDAVWASSKVMIKTLALKHALKQRCAKQHSEPGSGQPGKRGAKPWVYCRARVVVIELGLNPWPPPPVSPWASASLKSYTGLVSSL
jgi:hypothetical protein